MACVPVIKKGSLRKDKLLGRGHFSDVYKGKLVLPSGRIVRVALKEPVNTVSKLGWTPLEASVLHELTGEEGVPRLYGITAAPPYALVMSLCPGEVLDEHIKRKDVCVCLRALLQLCGVVRRLHERGITHGDIHAGNVLVHVTDGGQVVTTLLDFGLAEKTFNVKNQAYDVCQMVFTALFAIPCTAGLTALRRTLERTTDLHTVTELLKEMLRAHQKLKREGD